MSKSRIEDVISIISRMQQIHNSNKGAIKITDLRSRAISDIARQELNSRRFQNFDSALKSLQDACTRRLTKVKNIGTFERLTQNWLNNSSQEIVAALMYEIRSDQDRELINSFFRLSNGKSVEKPNNDKHVTHYSTPTAVDIELPALPERVLQTTYRILRDTELARDVKVENNFKCMICGLALELGDGKLYAEAHHIKPLGSDHNGPDTRNNILCVCPNHHALLDYGAIALDAHRFPSIKEEYIDYHNSVILKKSIM